MRVRAYVNIVLMSLCGWYVIVAHFMIDIVDGPLIQ